MKLAESKKYRFIKRLESIVGQENVIAHPDDLIVYEYDGSVDQLIPEVVVLPCSTKQVSQILELAYQEGIPVSGRGSGTGLSGGPSLRLVECKLSLQK